MTKFIELSAIDLAAERDAIERNGQVNYVPVSNPTSGERFENLDYDDLERPIPINVPFYPTHISVEHIREFHARKGGRTGTRIVFINSSATVVKESVSEVLTALNRLYN